MKTLKELLHSINEDSNVRALIQSSPICHKIFDPEYNLWFMSKSGVDALKIKNIEEFYGIPFPTEAAPESTREIFNKTMRLASKGETNTIEYSFTVDGKEIWYRTTITPFFCDNGNVCYIKADSMDITENVMNRKALAKAKEAAEKANQAKSDFLSHMSHELRTPLNSIVGFSQLLEMDAEFLTPIQLRNISRIMDSGNHLLHLINEILDLSQVEAGKSSMSMESVAIVDLLKEVILLMNPIAKENGINIHLEQKDNSHEFILADKTRLKQVILNLVSNAIKYNSKNGKIDIAIEDAPENLLRVSITDTGRGISEEKQKELFSAFNRLGAEKSKVDGTGIGLCITKKLIELMDGTLEVNSALGQGSCFYFELPLGEPHTDEDKTQSVETLPVTLINPSVENKFSILYVEDNPHHLELVKQVLLARNNIDVFSAPDARLGIDLAKVHQPDLILMDINLPGLSGIEACKILRKDPKTSRIPVMAISANAMEKDIQKIEEAGFVDYLTKPIKVSLLIDKISGVLK